MDLPALLHGSQFVCRLSRQVRHLDQTKIHALTSQPGKFQQIVDQFACLTNGLADELSCGCASSFNWGP